MSMINNSQNFKITIFDNKNYICLDDIDTVFYKNILDYRGYTDNHICFFKKRFRKHSYKYIYLYKWYLFLIKYKNFFFFKNFFFEKFLCIPLYFKQKSKRKYKMHNITYCNYFHEFPQNMCWIQTINFKPGTLNQGLMGNRFIYIYILKQSHDLINENIAFTESFIEEYEFRLKNLFSYNYLFTDMLNENNLFNINLIIFCEWYKILIYFFLKL